MGKPKRERLHSEIRHRISGGRAVSSASTGEWCSILPAAGPASSYALLPHRDTIPVNFEEPLIIAPEQA
jgi:hypothetical protein